MSHRKWTTAEVRPRPSPVRTIAELNAAARQESGLPERDVVKTITDFAPLSDELFPAEQAGSSGCWSSGSTSRAMACRCDYAPKGCKTWPKSALSGGQSSVKRRPGPRPELGGRWRKDHRPYPDDLQAPRKVIIAPEQKSASDRPGSPVPVLRRRQESPIVGLHRHGWLTKAVRSGLSRYGTTIFTVMSALASQHGAVNLGQGFPDDEGPESIRRCAAETVLDGPNQYPPMRGLAGLREVVSAHDRRSTVSRWTRRPGCWSLPAPPKRSLIAFSA